MPRRAFKDLQDRLFVQLLRLEIPRFKNAKGIPTNFGQNRDGVCVLIHSLCKGQRSRRHHYMKVFGSQKLPFGLFEGLFHFANHSIPNGVFKDTFRWTSRCHKHIGLAWFIRTFHQECIGLCFFKLHGNILVGHEIHIGLQATQVLQDKITNRIDPLNLLGLP